PLESKTCFAKCETPGSDRSKKCACQVAARRVCCGGRFWLTHSTRLSSRLIRLKAQLMERRCWLALGQACGPTSTQLASKLSQRVITSLQTTQRASFTNHCTNNTGIFTQL